MFNPISVHKAVVACLDNKILRHKGFAKKQTEMKENAFNLAISSPISKENAKY